MIKNEKEIECGFDKFLKYVSKHDREILLFRYGRRLVSGCFDSIEYEDSGDHGKFNSIIFKTREGVYFDITYLNMPDEIFHNADLIFKEENGVLKEIKQDKYPFINHKGLITFDRIIGVYVDPTTGEQIKTDRGIIHYTKNGYFLVPAYPERKRR